MFSSFASPLPYCPISAVTEPTQISFTNRHIPGHTLEIDPEVLAKYTAKKLIEHVFDYGLLPEKFYLDKTSTKISEQQFRYLEYFSKQLGILKKTQLELYNILNYMSACLCTYTEKTSNYSWAIPYLKQMLDFASFPDNDVRTIHCKEIVAIMSCNLVKFCRFDEQLYQLYKKEIINKMFSWVNYPDTLNINTIRQALLYIMGNIRLNNTAYDNVSKLFYSHSKETFFSDEFIPHRVFYYLISRIVFENAHGRKEYYQHKIKPSLQKSFCDYLYQASENDPNWEVQKVFRKLFNTIISL
jgi:hypothetical protein